MAKAPSKQLRLVPAKSNAPVQIDDIRARRTDELVIAFVGPVGSGCTTAARIIEKTLKEIYKYDDVAYYRVSSSLNLSLKSVHGVRGESLKV